MKWTRSISARSLTKRGGFTIVELLIVIVIIAILAAITIVAYNGIQTRANNSQNIAATKEFIKAYYMYAQDNNAYPAVSGCLGEGYPSNRCLSQSGTSECFGLGAAGSSTTINNALRDYMNGNLPNPSMQRAGCGTTSYIGIYAGYSSATQRVNVYSVFKGNIDCPAMSPNVASTTKLSQDDVTICRYYLESAG